jgi:hypothetical protein
MQRYTLTDVDGPIGKLLLNDPIGQWVKHSEVSLLESKAKQLGYTDIDDALSALAVYQEMERT